MGFISSLGIPVHMDYDGQRKAENITRYLITIAGILGLIVGFVEQKFSYTVYSLGVGFLLSSLICLPPWPMYRKKPLNWQKVRKQQ